ncbi:CPBP family intramembrane glutamic endopeptidase [Rhodohalobacter sp.]|uniref:CPBP family intramembrane glutamic endopeptidase n=1 Tax=Rhodohalobacter sp. TaxID=1974210 RepID=UPI0035618AFC
MEEKNQYQLEENLTGKNMLGMSLLSFLFYVAVSLLLIYLFHEGDFREIFEHGYSITVQMAIGLSAGIAAALVVMFLSSRSPIADVLDDFTLFRVIANTKFSPFDRVQISLFAGAGEEILFRGAIQPILGIWATSIIFIAIHGYFKFKSAGHILFGLMLFGLSMMLGFLYEISGLISAMAAHGIYDLVMLEWAKRRREE